MAKITKLHDVLQTAEFSHEQVVVDVRTGSFIAKDDQEMLWVHLDCVDKNLFTHAETLDIDPSDLPTLIVKIKNPDNRNWKNLIGQTISVDNATVVPIISNNQLKSLALKIDALDI